jgi:hypothetical protein
MKVGEFLLNEKTRVSLNIVNFIILVGFAITASFTFASWKTEFETIQQSEKARLTVEIAERKQADNEIKEDLNEAMTVLIETQTDLAEIKTDLKWIRAYMETK